MTTSKKYFKTDAVTSLVTVKDTKKGVSKIMLYRIFTENKNLETIEKIVSKHFQGFTIIKADGYWKLIKEGSLIIEVTDPNTDKNVINKLAQEIKEANTQEAVLVQEIKNDSWLV